VFEGAKAEEADFMFRRRTLRLAVAFMGAIAMVGVAPSAASAAPPTNDSFASATVVSSLPFSTTVDTREATWDESDPWDCDSNGSVWFSFTPATNTVVRADTFGSDYDTVLSAWTGSQGSLSLLACNDDANGGQSRVTFSATAGTTYYFMAASCCGGGYDGGGSLRFSVEEATPPPNDNFADAMTVNGIPFSNQQDLSAATIEPGEPTGCLNTSRTVWYSFTPTSTQSLSARVNQYGSGVAVYTGSSLADLARIACEDYYYYPATFRAEVGRTYFFQVGQQYGSAPVTFSLAVAPNPVAEFYYYPSDPSSFDTVSFSDYSSDPGNVGISSREWNLGDGTTSTERYVYHRYAADGDYTVRLGVTTPDGRTASTSRVVRVRTHDVSITRLAVPATAHVGQTIGITVNLQNTRYDETVTVTLDKSSPSGYRTVGSLTQLVQVKPAGQFTRFSFSHTITEEDLAIGKVTFRATAAISGSRDALSADNQLLSTPVNVV